MTRIYSRRQAFSLIAAAAAAPVLLPGAAVAQAGDVCRLTPQVTEGPFYTDPRLVRADMREGRPGVPLALRLQVVDARCQALAKARVDVWHCDALGLYSGYPGQGDGRDISTVGETFLRATQIAGADGTVQFTTLYPGWYRGRTPHIHFKAFIDRANVLTGQIFFPDALSEAVYSSTAPYSARGSKPDTTNAQDGIARRAGEASVASIKQVSDGYEAAMVIGIDPAAS
ncbi:protocatechuate dioxygenase [Oleomonas cavernae]|uniref:Protocatechuate dioxygenase n=1 Tax=Oleomonas cavernae TaxID=2320859 RepID=A0A418VTL4_9PROT|nr:intradiol ring-cleavage dioxygenase [Oleomonas cavernae]RJF80476.1 protocatechuate dioxygenase [Oleomonas cavernae]